MPEEWYHQGRLVLDSLNRPVIRYVDIPDVLSTTFPGYAIEAIMRIDSRIQMADIVARMPTTIQRGTGVVAMVQKCTLNIRTMRFRDQAGCLAWSGKLGSKAMEKFLEAHLAQELKAANTTKGFRDLTRDEVLSLKKSNAHLFAAREAKKKATAQAKAGADVALSGAAATAMATPAAEEPDAEGDGDDFDAALYVVS